MFNKVKNLIKISNKKTKLISIILVLISFNLGFLYRHSNPNYLFYLINKFEKKIKKPTSKEFCPKKIYTLPKNSTLIIGHAYGSGRNSKLKGGDGIAPKVYEFYLKNKQNIDSIIFSGDVLKEPTIKKWNDFYSKFPDDFKLFIAPGNHDVGGKAFDSALRDVFNIIPHKNQGGENFPFKLYLNKSLFIIGDSNAKKNSIDEIISIIEKERKSQKIYIVMHHAFPNGLKDAANSPGRHKFIKDSFFLDKFNYKNKKKIFFLYGDGNRRLKCIKLGNSYHMISGITESQGDTIFVINNNNLYRIEI